MGGSKVLAFFADHLGRNLGLLCKTIVFLHSINGPNRCPNGASGRGSAEGHAARGLEARRGPNMIDLIKLVLLYGHTTGYQPRVENGLNLLVG